MTHPGTLSWIVAGALAMALAGCTFGDDPPLQKAQPFTAPSFDENCVPWQCMYECCQGLNYDPDPQRRGGTKTVCDAVKEKNASYSEYDHLMQLNLNLCPDDFKYWE